MAACRRLRIKPSRRNSATDLPASRLTPHQDERQTSVTAGDPAYPAQPPTWSQAEDTALDQDEQAEADQDPAGAYDPAG